MKTCVKGSSGVHVKIMQAYLRHRNFTNDKNQQIGIDGSFGPSTLQSLLKFQKSVSSNSKDWDGSCGPSTWEKLAYYVPSKTNQNFWVQKIPIAKINKFDTHITNGKETSLLTHNKNNNDFLTLNAVFFSFGGKTDKYYMYNLDDCVIDGVLQNYGGNYSNIGIAINKNTKPFKMYMTVTSDCVGKKGIDFIAGTPPIIQNGVIKYDTKGIGNSFIGANSKTTRWGYGFTADNYYVRITTAYNANLSIPQLAAEAHAQGCIGFINCDGGGSIAEVIDGSYMYTKGRPVTTAFGLDFSF